MTAALEGGEWSAARPSRTLPPGKTRYPFYRKRGGPQGRSGRAENLVPTGIRSRTFQPVVSRYTDWATGPTLRMNTCTFIITSRSILLWMSNVSDQILKRIPKHILSSINFFPPESRAVYEIMWKNMVEPDRTRRAVWHGACTLRSG